MTELHLKICYKSHDQKSISSSMEREVKAVVQELGIREVNQRVIDSVVSQINYDYALMIQQRNKALL